MKVATAVTTTHDESIWQQRKHRLFKQTITMIQLNIQNLRNTLKGKFLHMNACLQGLPRTVTSADLERQ